MRISTLSIASMTLVLLMGIPIPGSAQEGEARLGGGSDIAADTTVRLPQGGSIPAIHVISADNPEDEPIDVEFSAVTPAGISVQPKWETATIPARGNVQNHFALEVGSNVAPGDYRVIAQLIRSDIETKPGHITNIPAIQTAFTVEVTGDAATITVRSVSAFTGGPVEGIITLSARDGAGRWFELNRGEGTTLETRVAPGDYRAAILLGDRELAAEEFTVEADQAHEVVLEVETVSFVLAAVRPVEEDGRVVVAELVASVNNETVPIAGPAVLQARVVHAGLEMETVPLLELPELPTGITEAAFTYRPGEGWQAGAYEFVFELVTQEFTLVATDQPEFDVPAVEGFELFSLLAALDGREAIALAAAVLLAIVLVVQIVRVVVRQVRRRRHATSGPAEPKPGRGVMLRPRQTRRWRLRKGPRRPKESWLEERIGPTTAQRSTWEESDDGFDASVTLPAVEEPTIRPNRTNSPRVLPEMAPDRVGGHELAPPVPSGRGPLTQAANGGDMASMVEALRVIEQLQEQGTLAPEWSITDATLMYWAIISPRIQESLDSVGMTEDEYVTAMRRLLSHGLLGAAATTDHQ